MYSKFEVFHNFCLGKKDVSKEQLKKFLSFLYIYRLFIFFVLVLSVTSDITKSLWGPGLSPFFFLVQACTKWLCFLEAIVQFAMTLVALFLGRHWVYAMSCICLKMNPYAMTQVVFFLVEPCPKWICFLEEIDSMPCPKWLCFLAEPCPKWLGFLDGHDPSGFRSW